MHDIVTDTIDTTFDVRARLARLHAWRDEWQQDDQQLVTRLRQLAPTDKDLGRQMGSLRQRLKLRCLREPLTFPQQLSAESVAAIRGHLVSQFATLTSAERLLWLDNLLFLMTPDLWRLHDKIKRVLRSRSFGQRRNFLLGGHSGMGKTTYLDWLTALNLPFVGASHNVVPMIKVDAPTAKNAPKVLVRRLILECGRTYLKGDDEEDLLEKLDLFLQQCEVQLMIIDEVEHLTQGNMRRRVLDISNMTQDIPIVCASCEPWRWTQGDVEVAGRWNDYFELTPYTGDRLSALLAFIEMLLPFTHSSHLAEQALPAFETAEGSATWIERWTKGILRDVMILVKDASEIAICDQQPSLSLAILERAWRGIQERPLETPEGACHEQHTRSRE